MSGSTEGCGLRAVALVFAMTAAIMVGLYFLLREPPQVDITEVFPSIVTLVKSVPDYVSAERTYYVEERETLDTPLWSQVEITRRYPVRVRAEVTCDAFDRDCISYIQSESTYIVTITLPGAILQPPEIDFAGAYRPEPDYDGIGADLIDDEERAQVIAQLDQLMEQNARTDAQNLAMQDMLQVQAEGNTAEDLTAAVLALFRARGFEDVEVLVVFGDAGTAPVPGLKCLKCQGIAL